MPVPAPLATSVSTGRSAPRSSNRARDLSRLHAMSSTSPAISFSKPASAIRCPASAPMRQIEGIGDPLAPGRPPESGWCRISSVLRPPASSSALRPVTKRRLASFAIALSLCVIVPAAQARSYLVSLTGIRLGANEFVERFAITTWGVRFKAVCHFPPGWTVTAGRTAAMDGTLSGEASHGVAFIDGPRLRELRGLALVTFDGPIRRSAGRPGHGPPATFAGTAYVGVYGGGRMRTTAIGYANMTLTPMDHCP